MNKLFRLIWSEINDTWVVVSEKVSAKGCRPAITVGTLVVSLFLLVGGVAYALDPGALPTNGEIVAGSGSIGQSGSILTVNQTSNRLIANWGTFNIGENGTVQFQQPGAASVALNRITDQNPSQIMGKLTANGQVFLLNSAGIIFGQSARVDVGGLVASSLNLSNDNFLAGNNLFDSPLPPGEGGRAPAQ